MIPPDLIIAARERMAAEADAPQTRAANQNGGAQASRIDADEAVRTGRDHDSIQLDQRARAFTARLTSGMSPTALSVAAADWAMHAGSAPGLLADMSMRAWKDAANLWTFAAASLAAPTLAQPVTPSTDNRRFKSESWDKWPWSLLAQSYLTSEAWWDAFTREAPGVDPANAAKMNFFTRQMLDALSPANNFWLNPEVLEATANEHGENLLRGAAAWTDDVSTALGAEGGPGDERFTVGRDLACTPGKVIYRNHLMEMIQYEPSTKEVDAEPILFVPAWIMKYYILDLSPENSMVRWLVDQGRTVFMISWRNPDVEDRDLSFDLYRRLGVMDAISAALDASGAERLHAAGYCLGGTLLSVAASAMARDGDDRLASLSLMAAQTDFAEAGELRLFIGESEIAMLESLMDERGYLDSKQMAGAFQMLRSNDLVWSRMVRDYWLGEPRPSLDLMAWNADATRMPAAMHSEYLRRFFLENAFARGAYKVDGRAVSFSDIRCPICAVGTTKDHVAPWRSVYKIRQLADAETTFILTNGGHNAGIVSEPGRARRHHQIATSADLDHYLDPDAWRSAAPVREGSWWPSWADWLAQRSSGETRLARAPRRANAPLRSLIAEGEPLRDAPGAYVLAR